MEQNRIETGPVKFDNDWTAIVIRGDNALWYSQCLKMLIEVNKDLKIDWLNIQSLITLLDSCYEGKDKNVQLLKDYKDCKL